MGYTKYSTIGFFRNVNSEKKAGELIWRSKFDGNAFICSKRQGMGGWVSPRSVGKVPRSVFGRVCLSIQPTPRPKNSLPQGFGRMYGSIILVAILNRHSIFYHFL